MKQFIKLLPILGVSVLTACSAGVQRGNCNTFLVEEGESQYQYGPCTTDDNGYTSKFERTENKVTETVKVENPTVDTTSSSNPITNTGSTAGSDSAGSNDSSSNTGNDPTSGIDSSDCHPDCGDSI